MDFKPARLTIARQRRELNKNQLATLAGVAARSLTAYEAGDTVPSAETLATLASVLRFPRSFFEAREPEIPSTDSVSFRALSSMKAAQRDAALAAGTIAFDACAWIEAKFTLPEADIPDLRLLSPEDAAITLRDRWGIGLLPIRSMVHLLESRGVRIFSLAEQCREVDAFSLWHGRTPFCFLNTQKSVEHSRFDAAHELGHIALHRHGGPQGREAEHQADAFASAFLMPRPTVIASVPRNAALHQLIQLKTKWHVSTAALAHRAHKVGLISEWNYRGLCIEMGRLGYRTNEPSPIPNRETSQVLTKVFSALRNEGVTRSAVAEELSIYQADLDAITFGLVMTGLDGGGSGSRDGGKKPSHLKLAPKQE